MALIDVTPVMTSNTTPSPYVASCSSQYGNADPYGAFCGSIWHSYGGKNTYPQWIKLDFGEKQKLDAFSIKMNSNTITTVAPKTFKLYGSIDDMIYDEIDSRNTETGWSLGETRIYALQKQAEYRYYKIEFSADNGYGYVVLGVGFYEDKEISYVSHKNASLLYTIPMNTTQNILARTNDPRVGLLGMANDAENYGDLYVIGGDGKSHITKSGVKSEVIFDGRIRSTGLYDITKPIKDFKVLMIEMENTTDGGRLSYNTTYVSDSLMSTKQFLMYEHGTRYIKLEITDDEYKLNITAISALYIRKIIGIY